jgi:hypothetical protein
MEMERLVDEWGLDNTGWIDRSYCDHQWEFVKYWLSPISDELFKLYECVICKKQASEISNEDQS